jgi:hypothetical protein
MKKLLLALVIPVVLASSAGLLHAERQGVGGSWTFASHGISLHLVLSQEGNNITGTLDSPHGGVFHLTGEFVDGTLTLTGVSEGGDLAIQISCKGTLQSDGSLAGNMTSNVGDMAWTAVRTSGN